MAKTKISEFSTTAGNNTDINSINIAEGCAPSGINDAIRELMRQLKEFQTGGAGDSVNSGGDFSVATNKFTVASASGNTSVAGTLGVTGAATLSSTLAVTGTTTLTGALLANGNATLGDASGDTVTIKGTPTLEVNPTLSGGTANGVLYLNGSKVATSGSALTFNGTKLQLGAFGNTGRLFETYGSEALFDGGGQFDLLIGDGGVAYMSLTTTDNAASLKIRNYSGNSDIAVFERTSGNVGIGTSSPSGKLTVLRNLTGATDYSTEQVSVFNSASGAAGNQATIGFHLNNSNWGPATTYARISAVLENGTTGATALAFGTATDGSLATPTERARIDSSGNLLVACTSLPASNRTKGFAARDNSTGGFQTYQTASSSDWAISASSGSICNFYSDNGSALVLAGQILVNGNITTYSSISDYRLKENVQPMVGALDKVQALKPVTYTFKNSGQISQGFIAHELAEVCPQAVTGEKDAVNENGNPKYQGIDTSFLVATLTAAIQELKAEFDAYKASHP